jgi:hypothetical protein
MAANSYTLEESISTFSSGMAKFDAIFQANLSAAIARQASGAVTSVRKALDEAVTDWGLARMAGEAAGVKFQPYGNSAGRNDTGNMIDSVAAEVFSDGNGEIVMRFGWIFNQEDYFLDQEYGFESRYTFNKKATIKSGEAQFRKGQELRPREGANSLESGLIALRKRGAAFLSAVWNDTNREYQSAGGFGVGTFMQARKSYYDRIFGRDQEAF